MIICFAFYVQCARAGEETTFGTVASMTLIMYNFKLRVHTGAFSELCFMYVPLLSHVCGLKLDRTVFFLQYLYCLDVV